MPYNVLRVDRDQMYLMAPSIRDWLPEGHLAWFLLLSLFMSTGVFAAAREKLEQMGMVSRLPLKLGEVRASSATIPRGRKFELTFSLDATFDNPFDPEDIDVSCQFTTPSGRATSVPAFFCTPFTRQADGSVGQSGKAGWKVRFAPMEIGVHRYRVTARDRNGRVESALGDMTCVAADNDGVIRVSSVQPYALEFESGKPYLPLGFNLFIWTALGSPIPADRLARCEKFMNRLADAGGNFVRLRMDSWWNAIEMTPDEATGYLGLGWYHQQTCYEIDLLYELAEKRGLYVMHCLDNAHSSVNDPPREGQHAWRRRYNLYLKDNGGPCAKSEDFWTDAATAQFVRRKLRYCLARWGYSRNVMCWEFWNEVTCRPDTVEAAAKWHQDMARYLWANDPYRHPITTSIMGDEVLFDRLWQQPEMEIAQTHVYGQPDLAAAMASILGRAAKQCRKPFFFGEFGIGPIEGKWGGYDFDGQGVHLQNGLWAPVVSGAAGAGAFWNIEEYLDKLNLWPRFRPLADWAQDVPWNAPDLKPLAVKRLDFIQPPTQKHYIDFMIPTSQKWAFKYPPEDRFIIGSDGRVGNAESLRPHLYCFAPRQRAPTFVLNCPVPAELRVHVTASVGDARNKLLIDLDGKRVVERPFPAGEGHGKSRRYIAQYQNWFCDYDEWVSIPLPTGQHEVRLDAVGKDRLEVEYYLKNYVAFEDASPLRVWGRATAESAFFWVQGRLSTWHNLFRKVEPIPVSGMGVTLGGLKDGEYEIEWWDTWAGQVLRRDQAKCVGDELVIALPTVVRDVAAKARRK